MRADQRLDRHPLGRAILAILEEVKQNHIERTGGRQVARQCQVGDHVGGILCVLAGADVAGAHLMWKWQVGVDGPALAIVEQKIDAQTLVKGHIGVDARLMKLRAWTVARVAA